jgi:hypothetical protein
VLGHLAVKEEEGQYFNHHSSIISVLVVEPTTLRHGLRVHALVTEAETKGTIGREVLEMVLMYCNQLLLLPNSLLPRSRLSRSKIMRHGSEGRRGWVAGKAFIHSGLGTFFSNQ